MKTLEETLVEILDKTTQAIDKGTDFTSDKIPDVIAQLLLWYGVYNFILFIAAIIGIYVQYVVSKWWIFDIEPNIEASSRWIGTIFGVGVVGVAFTIFWVYLLNLTWLKIWIAPKLFLIEYMSNIAKG